MQILRRQSLKGIGLAFVAAGFARNADAMPAPSLIPGGAHTLEALNAKLEKAPRRRDFTTVPMILDNRDQWDAEALDAVLTYAGGPKQSWDNTDLTGPWLNVMRNAMNVEIWGFKHPDFLCVSATHGTAQLVLYDESIWEKYSLAKLAGGSVTREKIVLASAASDHDPASFEATDGPFSGAANNIVGLQRRGAVFLACHNAVWEHADKLIAADLNPDHLTTDKLCAELTNHLIAGVVLTPGAVGTLVELHSAGFAYAR
jgi:hypothetical protein